MNGKHYILFGVIIAILLTLNVVMVLKVKVQNEVTSDISEKITDFEQYYGLFRSWTTATVINNDTRLSPEVGIEDENGIHMSLSQIAESKTGAPKLVIKNSALACSICLEEEFKHINNYISAIGSENVVVLVSHYNLRSLKTIKQSAPFDFGLYHIEQLGIPFEKEHSNLFVFILDEELKIKNFFVPEKTLPELSQNYYKTVSEKYF